VARDSATPELLPLRWAVIFVSAAVIGTLIGGLMLAQARSWPAALLAALAALGSTVAGLHQLLDR
jgi:hypothetical protein